MKLLAISNKLLLSFAALFAVDSQNIRMNPNCSEISNVEEMVPIFVNFLHKFYDSFRIGFVGLCFENLMPESGKYNLTLHCLFYRCWLRVNFKYAAIKNAKSHNSLKQTCWFIAVFKYLNVSITRFHLHPGIPVYVNSIFWVTILPKINWGSNNNFNNLWPKIDFLEDYVKKKLNISK